MMSNQPKRMRPDGVAGMNVNMSQPMGAPTGGDISSMISMQPTSVLLVCDIPPNCTERDLTNLFQRYGVLKDVQRLPDNKNAVIEFGDMNVVMQLVQMGRSNPFFVGPNRARLEFALQKPGGFMTSIGDSLQQQQTPGMTAMGGDMTTGLGDVSGKILHFEITNCQYPINVDVINTICSPNGKVARICIGKKNIDNSLEALVEFETATDAKNAGENLNGADIYSGCCTLNVTISKLLRVHVTKNDTEQWDYTINAPGKEGLLGTQPSQPKTLLDGNNILMGNTSAMTGGAMNTSSMGNTSTGMMPPTASMNNMGTPMSGNMGNPMGGSLGNNMGGTMGGPIGNNMGGSMGNNMGGPMGNNMGGPMGNNMGGPMGNNMSGPMGNNMGGPMGNNMGGPMGNNMGGPIGNNMGGPMGNNMGAPMGSSMGGPMGNMAGPMGNMAGPMGSNMNMPGNMMNMGGNMMGSGMPGHQMSKGNDYFSMRPPPGQGPPPAVLQQQQGGSMMPPRAATNQSSGPISNDDNFVAFQSGEGTVVMCYNMGGKMNCDHLFNLFCLYGNVARVKFLKSRQGCAMIQMGSKEASENVLKHYDGIEIFGSKIQVCRSKQTEVQDHPNPISLTDGTPLVKSYISDPNNRFRNSAVAAKSRILPPSRTLHFFNAPLNFNEEDMKNVFSSHGAKSPDLVMNFPPKPGQKTGLGLVEWDNTCDALDALALSNHCQIKVDGVPHPFHLKLAYSPKPIDESKMDPSKRRNATSASQQSSNGSQLDQRQHHAGGDGETQSTMAGMKRKLEQ